MYNEIRNLVQRVFLKIVKVHQCELHTAGNDMIKILSMLITHTHTHTRALEMSIYSMVECARAQGSYHFCGCLTNTEIKHTVLFVTGKCFL